MKKLIVLFVLAAFVFTQTLQSAAQDTAQDEQANARQEARQQAQAPAKSETAEEVKKRLRETVTSFSFTRADLKSTLVAMGKLYDLNILAGDDVKGLITINLKDVTMEDALRAVLKMNNYTYVMEGSIIKVIGLEEEKITDVINLNFIEGSLASELAGKMLSTDSVVKINEAMNQLIVTDKAANIEKVRDFLTKVDLPPQQVMIEAKLVDISHTDLDNLGISWQGSLNVKVPLTSGPFVGGREQGGKDYTKLTTFDGSLPGTSSTLDGGEFTLGFTQGPNTFDITLDALIRNSKAKLLASPTIAALNNVEAKITIGEKYPIREQTQTTTGTLETTRFVDIGITLKVTPKISRDGYIQMAIHPEVSSLSSAIDAGPRITTREADTTVIIPDGQTIVIAGLIKDDNTITISKVPVLGYIPIIGLLFSNRSKTIEQKELAIFITPRLMPIQKEMVKLGGAFTETTSNLDAIALYEKARDLELARSLSARNKRDLIRYLEAVKLYQELAESFPLHSLTPEALSRAGGICYYKLHETDRGRQIYKQLADTYPDTSYGRDAGRLVAKINRQAKGKRR